MGYYVKTDDDVKIYVEDINPKCDKTILFIHGWPANHNLFEYQFDELPKLGYRCIGIDIRGFGKSDKPAEGYDYDRLADDVRCVVNAIKLKNFTLGGHSVGGAIAIKYMSRHKGYGVSKLALFAAAAPSLTRRPEFPAGISKEDVTALIEQTYVDRPKMLRTFGEMFFFQNITKPFSQWFFNLGLEASGIATAAVATSFRDEELFSDIKKIEVPTLILHGIHDKVCLFPLAVALSQGIKDSKLVPFENSGHGLFYEEKDKFNKELIKFIED
ncbi:alpha/beta fold hydrolase [Clostridium fungisolvens]|uniref:Arylesterase n=1 Tax=Clostridium fungisolvens TaxID=1604897 RepID=A0A6V8SHG3_9CLOT|nr:alpha/beta hydrolase [Clostridium fungisolvens]GFP74578.1 Arylesterase [Clostridium fungisolvens]